MPSCDKPNGGGKTQDACFCPEGKVLVDENCMDVGKCGCEYGGKIFKVSVICKNESFNR